MDQLERLVASDAIRAVQARYARYADTKDWEGFASLFLPSATFTTFDLDGRAARTLTGPEEIVAQIVATVGSGILAHRLFSYEIDFASSSSARGIWTMEDWVDLSLDHEAGRPVPFRSMRGAGHYHVDYEEIGNRWLIAGLKLTRTRLDFDP